MRLVPGTPLAASLVFDEVEPALPIGRLAMAGGLAQPPRRARAFFKLGRSSEFILKNA